VPTSLTHSLAQMLGIFGLIPAVPCVIFGVRTLRVAIAQIIASRNVSRLRPIPGRIDSSHVDVKEVHHHSSSSTSASYKYRPIVRYTYVVDCKDDHGERINLNLAFYSEASARALVALYPANSNVTVFNSPDMPEWFLLETQIE